jgi:hypothetical protein
MEQLTDNMGLETIAGNFLKIRQANLKSTVNCSNTIANYFVVTAAKAWGGKQN